jgi:hypothetical protein
MGLFGCCLCLAVADYILPSPVRWPDLFYCLGDRALRRHIHLTPPQYSSSHDDSASVALSLLDNIL